MKESVGELKESVKALGNSFKKKDKATAGKPTDPDTVKAAKPAQTTHVSIATAPLLDIESTLPNAIKEIIIGQAVKNFSQDKPKMTKNEEATYVNIQFDFGGGVSSSVYFSRLKNENVIGDLNNDGQEDVIVKVYSNTGGNTDYLDLYVFLQQASSWKLLLVKSSSDEDIKGCQIGQYVPLTISNGFLIGESSCFLQSDPRCCPSLFYKTTLKLQNNQLVFVRKERTVKKN